MICGISPILILVSSRGGALQFLPVGHACCQRSWMVVLFIKVFNDRTTVLAGGTTLTAGLNDETIVPEKKNALYKYMFEFLRLPLRGRDCRGVVCDNYTQQQAIVLQQPQPRNGRRSQDTEIGHHHYLVLAPQFQICKFEFCTSAQIECRIHIQQVSGSQSRKTPVQLSLNGEVGRFSSKSSGQK